jgi:hypothetical protein
MGYHEVIDDPRAPAEHETADHRHAGMDSRHLGSQGHLWKDLDSSAPCWNECARESATSAR